MLAREVVVEADEDFELRAVLGRLRAQQPGCFVYAAGELVGASPELLVRRTGDASRSRCPMAGTVAADAGERRGRARSAESVKDDHEHRFVVDAIVDALAPRCESLDVAAVPELARFSSLAHLTTPIRGILADPAPTALELAAPAAPHAGRRRNTPRRGAVAHPPARDRATAAATPGPVGWVDGRGDGEWAVALRGAEVARPHRRAPLGRGHRRRLRARGGVGRDRGQARPHAPRPRPPLTPALPHSRTPALPHSRTPALPRSPGSEQNVRSAHESVATRELRVARDAWRVAARGYGVTAAATAAQTSR